MSEKTLPETDKNYTVEQYAEMERQGAGKHEFAGGRILPTASSSRTHNLIGSSLRKIALAFVSFICGVYFGLARKVMCPLRAKSSPAAPVISNSFAPCERAEKVFSAKSLSCIFYFLRNLYLSNES